MHGLRPMPLRHQCRRRVDSIGCHPIGRCVCGRHWSQQRRCHRHLWRQRCRRLRWRHWCQRHLQQPRHQCRCRVGSRCCHPIGRRGYGPNCSHCRHWQLHQRRRWCRRWIVRQTVQIGPFSFAVEVVAELIPGTAIPLVDSYVA